jgi:hypothetical protein
MEAPISDVKIGEERQDFSDNYAYDMQ